MPVKNSGKDSVSLRFKLLIPLLALITVIFAASYFGIRQYLRNTIYNLLDEETTAITDYITDCLDTDVLNSMVMDGVDYDESAGWSEGMIDERYWDQQLCLETAGASNPRTAIFTYHVVDQNTLIYGLDQYAMLDPEYSYVFGEEALKEDEDYENMLRGLKGVYHYDDLKHDEAGGIYYYATITPIKTPSGETIGGLVVYLAANFATESLQYISNILLALFAVIYALFVLLVLVITRRVTAQLTELQAAASRVADGNYTPITLKPQSVNDEVSALAGLFNIMLDKVRVREESLKQEVVELKIQIDMERKNKEVKEIVESEFFQDLKTRAATARKQRQQNQGE